MSTAIVATVRRYADTVRAPVVTGALVSRLACGMTAGEEALLEEIVEAAEPLSAGRLLAWHDGLPPPSHAPEPPHAELIAALIVTGPSPR
jgi:hypothetical protein